MTHRRTWQKFETTVARFFGVERSGPMQAKDASDIDHGTIHAQCKLAKKHAIVSVWDAALAIAKNDKKIPVVAIKVKGRHGWWIMCKSEDLLNVAGERCIAIGGSKNNPVDNMIVE